MPRPDVAIVTLTRYPEIFAQFCRSAEAFEQDAWKIVVTSGGAELGGPRGWMVLQGIEPFVWARNANIGIAAAGKCDVLLVNDDVQFLEHGSICRLRALAHQFPNVGLLSPQIDGGVGNPLQWRKTALKSALHYSEAVLCAVCLYIKRSTIDRVGLFDERFDQYGGEDADYSKQVQDAGLKLAVTPLVTVQHGYGDTTYSASYLRRMCRMEREKALWKGMAQYREKWGCDMRLNG